jgi:hypothetical protein
MSSQQITSLVLVDAKPLPSLAHSRSDARKPPTTLRCLCEFEVLRIFSPLLNGFCASLAADQTSAHCRLKSTRLIFSSCTRRTSGFATILVTVFECSFQEEEICEDDNAGFVPDVIYSLQSCPAHIIISVSSGTIHYHTSPDFFQPSHIWIQYDLASELVQLIHFNTHQLNSTHQVSKWSASQSPLSLPVSPPSQLSLDQH